MKHLSMIACVSSDFGLGRDNALLWHLPADQAFFRRTTMGHPVVMGRKTFASIGRALPGRENIVLSHRPVSAPGIQSFSDFGSLEAYLETLSGEKFIIGGASLYSHFLPAAERIYLTEVAAEQPADTFFPRFQRTDFTRQVLSRHHEQDQDFEIVLYERRQA